MHLETVRERLAPMADLERLRTAPNSRQPGRIEDGREVHRPPTHPRAGGQQIAEVVRAVAKC